MDNPIAPVPPETPQAENQPEKKQGFPWSNILVVVFIVALLVTVLSQNLGLSSAMLPITVILGMWTAGNFLNRMARIAKGRAPAEKFFISLVGAFGAVIIFFISFFAAFSGVSRNSPPIEGD